MNEVADNCFVNRVLDSVFEQCFLEDYRSLLVGGAAEPSYEPATASEDVHRLYYREDFFASALHEVAHWCLAGQQRRLLKDYGYWYSPDGRDHSAQQEFEKVEYKPQALEWMFSMACAYPFSISADNLNGDDGVSGDDLEFRQRVIAQARHWCSAGLPPRGQRFYNALCEAYGRSTPLLPSEFSLVELGRGQWKN